MRVFLTLAAAAFLASAQPSLAMDSMHTSMMKMMPTCAASDPVVGVNMKTKMYMTHAQMKAKASGMSESQIHAMMRKNDVKLMCKSQAEKMGAKMTSNPM